MDTLLERAQVKIVEEGVKRFELEDIRLLERSGSVSSAKYETPTEMEAAQALKNKLQ